MATKKPAFSVNYDLDELFEDEVNFRLSPAGVDEDWADDFLKYSDNYPSDIKEALEDGRMEDAVEAIAKIPSLYDEVRNAFVNDDRKRDYITAGLSDAWDSNYSFWNDALMEQMQAQHPANPYLPDADNIAESHGYVIIGKNMGWQNDIGGEILDCKDDPEMLLHEFSLNGDYTLHIKQQDENVPAFEVKRYSHDEPTGASFLAVPLIHAYEVLNTEGFEDYKRIADHKNAFGRSLYDTISDFHELKEHFENFNKAVAAYNAGELPDASLEAFYIQDINESFGKTSKEMLSISDNIDPDELEPIADYAPLDCIMMAIEAVEKSCRKPDESLEEFFAKLDADHFAEITPFCDAKDLFIEAKQTAYKNIKCEGLEKIINKNLQTALNEAKAAGFDSKQITDILHEAVENLVSGRSVEDGR